jgi:predicted glycoside hydrolase/deacetylase ChbG (UPF0249 family)
VRRLIINADDFGLTSGVNRAIAEAHSHGVVTSTTLMANGRVRSLLAPAGREALSFPARSSGVAAVAPTVGSTNRFYDGFGQIAVRSFRGRLDSQQIEEEVTAQIRRLQEAGVAVTHVDAHKHTHMVPQVAEAIMRAASVCGVRAIRNPFVPMRPIIFAHVMRRPKLWTRYSEVTVLRRYHHAFVERLHRHNMICPDGSFGVVVTGSLDMELFRAVIGCVPDGTWEFVCHPGYQDQELSLVNTRLRESREKERAILTSHEARQILSDHNIELISYRDLAAND